MGDGGTWTEREKRIPKLSFPIFKPSSRRTWRPFSFSRVSGKLPSPSMSALIQSPCWSPQRIPPPNGQGGLPKALGSCVFWLWEQATLTLQPSFLCAYPLLQQKAIFGGAFHRHMTAEGGQARTTSLLAHDDATAQRCTVFLEVPSPVLAY